LVGNYGMMPKLPAPRFGIGEWYGYSFIHLTPEQRKHFATLAPIQTIRNALPCPFLSGETSVPCPKKGGICSLRLYEAIGDGGARASEGSDGSFRVVCPHRFKQDGVIYRSVGEKILGTPDPTIVAEVRFLRRNDEAPDVAARGSDTQSSEDVGNIDNVLVHPDTDVLRWCALEIQAVYFSGSKMGHLFDHIRRYEGPEIPFPDRVRRPDYRSSGPKRLMPQLQIKVPTLRRWGKKMAVVVDVAWFRTNVVGVQTVNDVSNCDIAWFLVAFDETTDPATLTVGCPELQTLERAVEGLTGGYPVTLSEFELKLCEKMNLPHRRSRREPNPDSGR
jgi:hypothetical protein